MASPTDSLLPRLISLRTISANAGDSFEWHAHPFEEFTLVTDDSCIIGYPPGWRPTKPNTLLHYRPGEVHGAAAAHRQRPRFWVVHFVLSDSLRAELGCFAEKDSLKRVWTLSTEQQDTFQWLFL